MTDSNTEHRVSRRRFLRTAAFTAGGLAAGSLLQACAPAAPAAPTSAPAKAGATAAPAAKQAAPAAAPKGGTPLKIGILNPSSGVYAQLGGESTDSMLMYWEEQGNTIAGRPIEIIREDEGDPQVSLQKARKLIESDKVDLVAGIIRSDVALAVRDIFHQNKKLLIVGNAGANDVTGSRKSPYIFRTSFANSQVGYAMGEWFYNNVAKEAFVAAADYAAGREDVAGFVQSFTQAGGTIVGEAWPPFPGTDYADYLVKIRNAGPPATFHFFAGADATKFIKQAAEFGLMKEMKVTGAGFMVEEDLLPAEGDAALGVINSLHYAVLLDNPLNKAYVKAYTDKFQRDPSVYSMQGYDTAKVISEALAKTNGDASDPDKLADAFRATTWDSPRGPVEFDESQNVVQNFYIREVQKVNGKLHNVVLATIPKVAWPPKA